MLIKDGLSGRIYPMNPYAIYPSICEFQRIIKCSKYTAALRTEEKMTRLKSQSPTRNAVELKLPSLLERRREIDMVQAYKMVNDANTEQIFVRADERRERRKTS